MSFSAGADEYEGCTVRCVGPRARRCGELGGVSACEGVGDVGCGSGALAVGRDRGFGAAAVWAVDPSDRSVAAVRLRHAQVRVEVAWAEKLPFAPQRFDAALAQLVVHFMGDPVAGLREMARVTRADGVVAACVWDHAGGHGPLSLFWRAARELDPNVEDESRLAGARRGHLGELLYAAGVAAIEETILSVAVEHPSFEEWWEPFMLGVGPAGAYVGRLDARRQAQLRDLCRETLPPAPFSVTARAWAARGHT